MADKMRTGITRGLLLLMLLVLVGGCASYQGRVLSDEAEQLAAEEKYDQSVGKYLEALQRDPGNKTYKLKLLAVRTHAAAVQVEQARALVADGKLEESLAYYQRAREFDPGIELISQEMEAVVRQLEARRLIVQAETAMAEKRFDEARALVRQTLRLDPENSAAAVLQTDLQQATGTVVLDDVTLDVLSNEPLTLRFKNAKVREVFTVLTKLTGINFILDEDIRAQSISVLLEKASFAQAMELILQMNGLGKKVLNSKTIIIYPLTREKEKQYGDQIIQTFYLSHIDAKKAVNLLRTMLQLRKIFVHDERNALIIRDKPEVIRLAEQILNAADRDDSEVLFALELVSVSDNDDLLFGPKLDPTSVSVGFSDDGTSLVSGALGTTTDGLVQSLNGLQTYYTVPSVIFDLKKTYQDTEILASPKIRVRNREKAKVHIGTREPVVTTTTTDTSTSSNVQYVDVGVKVDVEPVVQLNNTVETKLRLEVSQVTDRETLNGVTALTISTTNAETVLTLKDGVQTVLGGLFEEEDGTTRTTVPILGDIPLLGNLFTNFDDRNRKREILLSITPYIVKQVEVPELEVATIWSGGEDNFKVGPNFGAFARQPFVSEIDLVAPASAPALKETTQAVVTPPTAPKVVAPGPDPVEAFPQKTPVDKLQTSPEAAPASKPKAAPAQLSISGPVEAKQGDEILLSVAIAGASELYSAPLFVQFDPGLLKLLEVREGDFLKQGKQQTQFTSNVNPATGQVIIGAKQQEPGSGASGDGTLFTLKLSAVETGAAVVELERANFRDAQGNRLNVETAGVQIDIR